MNVTTTHTNNYYNDNAFRNLFIVWFLLLPFDAFILPVSLGVMTVYPFLLITVLLLAYSFWGKSNESFTTIHKIIIGFFFFWLVYGLFFFPFVPDKKIAFYEIRSLVLMAIYTLILFRTRYLMGKQKFFSLLAQLSSFVLAFFIILGFFEFFTGIHINGHQTDKLWTLPAGMITYAPLFFYDNPNTALCFLFTYAILAFICSPSEKFNSWKNSCIIFVLFFFSMVADSKFGKISSYMLFAYWLLVFVWERKNDLEKKYVWWTALALSSLIIVALTKPLFFGPLWKSSEHYRIHEISPVSIINDSLHFYKPDSLVTRFGEEKVVRSFREYQIRGSDWGINIRKNLLKNGWHLVRQSKFLGVGPGQFMWYHSQKRVPYTTTTVTNPHFYVMEILSQYGLLVLIPFAALFLLCWINGYRKRKINIQFFYLLSICYLIAFIVSIMPSSFLILNFGWVLIPVLLLAPSQLEGPNA